MLFLNIFYYEGITTNNILIHYKQITPSNIMNNDEHKISILQQFEKPEPNFIKDKECLICLEQFDLEANQHVMLPCKCANSTYHIGCIVLLLNSGQNKNFCPHCKGNYEIPLPSQQLTNLTQIQQRAQQLQNLQISNLTHVLVIHIISNSIMNIINIVLVRNAVETNVDEILQVLILFYFIKLFFNYCILMYSKSHIDKTEDCLVYSYTYQMVIFGILIYSLTRMKNNDTSTILIANNVFLSFGDIIFRIIIEYRSQNTVVAV
jgi:hypothetical protein